MASDAPTGIATTRRDQMFPVLTESEIARISRSATCVATGAVPACSRRGSPVPRVEGCRGDQPA